MFPAMFLRNNVTRLAVLCRCNASSATLSLDPSTTRALEPHPVDEIRKRHEKFEPPPDSRISKTVILGCPNAGKSVLTNALVDSPISAVSSKVHTTRKTTRGACLLDDRTQLLVLDTPGVVTSSRAKRHELEESLLLDPEGAMLGADTACVVVDAAGRFTRDRLDARIMHLLYRHRLRMTSVLVLAKVDAVKSKTVLLELATKLTKGVVGGQKAPAKKADLLLARGGESPRHYASDNGEIVDHETMENDLKSEMDTGDSTDVKKENANFETTRKEMSVDDTLQNYWTGVNWTLLKSITDLPWKQVQESMLRTCYRDEVGWPLFDRVFMISALQGTGVDELRLYLRERATTGKWRFHPSVITDQDPQELVKNVIRSKLMDRLKYHIPYTLDFKVCVWEINENDVLCIRMDVITRQERDGKFIIGPKGKTVADVAQEVTQVLRNLFQREVFFRLGVYTVKK